MTLKLRTACAALGVVVLCVPQSAWGCSLTFRDKGAPLAPCDANDSKLRKRVNEGNAWLLGRVGANATKIVQAAREVYAVQQQLAQARQFYTTMRQLYGDLTADPVPSLLTAINRTQLVAQRALMPNGELAPLGVPLDLRFVSDSIANLLVNKDELQRKLRGGRQFLAAKADYQVQVLGQHSALRLREALDYNRRMAPFKDSLLARGIRGGTRFGGDASNIGLAEAIIFNTEGSVTAIKGRAMVRTGMALLGQARARDDIGRQRSILDSAAQAFQRIRTRE